jgi:hypothetical protein
MFLCSSGKRFCDCCAVCVVFGVLIVIEAIHSVPLTVVLCLPLCYRWLVPKLASDALKKSTGSKKRTQAL